jgi:hypothetical protein
VSGDGNWKAVLRNRMIFMRLLHGFGGKFFNSTPKSAPTLLHSKPKLTNKSHLKIEILFLLSLGGLDYELTMTKGNKRFIICLRSWGRKWVRNQVLCLESVDYMIAHVKEQDTSSNSAVKPEPHHFG